MYVCVHIQMYRAAPLHPYQTTDNLQSLPVLRTNGSNVFFNSVVEVGGGWYLTFMQEIMFTF